MFKKLLYYLFFCIKNPFFRHFKESFLDIRKNFFKTEFRNNFRKIKKKELLKQKDKKIEATNNSETSFEYTLSTKQRHSEKYQFKIKKTGELESHDNNSRIIRRDSSESKI
jgi:hypothetical protein